MGLHFLAGRPAIGVEKERSTATKRFPRFPLPRDASDASRGNVILNALRYAGARTYGGDEWCKHSRGPSGLHCTVRGDVSVNSVGQLRRASVDSYATLCVSCRRATLAGHVTVIFFVPHNERR